jgi:protocatechuate 3,4-dioxygenase beta subunit
MLMKMARVEPAGPKLGGPIDVVLPVPPPVSFRADLIPPDVAGEPLTISGVVYAADRETPLPGVLVEVWQANPTGFYEGYDHPAPAFNLGGQMRTDATGRYEFITLKPSPVKVGQTDLPAQIHFKVSYQDQEPFFTRLFFADDPFLNNLPPSPEQTIRLNEQVRPTGSVWQGNFDIILPVSPSSETPFMGCC